MMWARRMLWGFGYTRCLLLLCFLSSCWLLVGAAEAQVTAPELGHSLFRSAKTVVELDAGLWRNVHRSAHKCPWSVMFYNDGCGHCRAVAPRYVSFSTRLEECHEEDPLRMVTAAALNCATEVETCRAYGIDAVPMFMLFLPANCTAGTNVTCTNDDMRRFLLGSGDSVLSELRMETRRLIKQTMHFDGAAMERCADMRYTLYKIKDQRIHPGHTSSDTFVETRKLYPTDIAGAFFYTLLHEVALMGFDPPERLRALKDFLLIVEHALPGLEAGAVLDAVRSMEVGGAFSVARWQKAVIAANIPFEGKPREVQWRTCKGSSVEYRGFPCAMWLLFHSLTVNAEVKTLETIRNYVRFFFTCEDCRRHFLQLNFEPDGDSVMQLWRAHNSVNARLAEVKGAADPFVPKRQFPDSAMCSSCLKPGGAFDEAEVSKYLQKRYEWDPDALQREEVGPTNPSGLAPVNAPTGNSKAPGGAEGTTQQNPMPFHVFLTGFTIVGIVSAGILRVRGKYITPYGTHRRRSRV
ncbi:putative quiescin sulfhydryl oxidase [Trypanosoma grayi]|uniref:putative quiescin sulfhydryl oxidase n=1 Tax=Trypanosoma grayi TaxID=71804 RepID=UPI0004F4383E|nr:putative quiescin sulfhydryl oxidase [Trypanosoma grayi]KEG09901.1 putative quiescin sulfhydryl oxidase [Trypanosoma grayi]